MSVKRERERLGEFGDSNGLQLIMNMYTPIALVHGELLPSQKVYTYPHTHTHPPTRSPQHAPTHAHTHTHTHTHSHAILLVVLHWATSLLANWSLCITF